MSDFDKQLEMLPWNTPEFKQQVAEHNKEYPLEVTVTPSSTSVTRRTSKGRTRTYKDTKVPSGKWQEYQGNKGKAAVNRAQNNAGRTIMPIMLTALGGAPAGLTGLFSSVGGYIGSEVGAPVGGYIGKQFGHEQAGEFVGGLAGGFIGGGLSAGAGGSSQAIMRDVYSGRNGTKPALDYWAKQLNNQVNNTRLSVREPYLNVGWGPAKQIKATWAHTQPNERLSTNLPAGKIRWDADGRGMPTTGGWVTEGRPGGMMAERPYIDWYDITLNKPMTQVGEIVATGKNATRSQLVRNAETLGADGFQFKGIADNRAKNQNVTYLYDPDSSAKPFGYLSDNIQELLQTKSGYTTPQFQIKSLMGGNALEKQLSKEGTISINSVRAHANKASKIEQEAIKWVLDNKFNGQNRINYAQLKQEVSNVLPKFEKRRVTKWETYGLGRIGYDVQEIPDGAGGIVYVASDKPVVDVRMQLLKDDELPLDLANNKAFNERFERVPWQQREDFYARMFGLDRGNNDSNFKYAYWDKLNNTYADTKDVLSWINEQGLNPSNRRVATNSYSYSNPIVGTNDKHYNSATAHTRTFHLPDQDPNTLYVLEAQSDWAQNFTDELKQWQRTFDLRPANNAGLAQDFNKPGLWENKSWVNGDYPLDYRPEATNMQNYLKDNMQRLLLQQNLKHAKENNFTRMRYPTPDTAAKIEGYHKDTYTADQLADYVVSMEPENYIEPEMRNSPDEFYLADDLDTFNKMVADSKAWDKTPTGQRFNKLWQKLKTMSDDDIHTQHSPEHETILNKYAEFPKMYEKLYGKGAVKEVTDHKGNTWYEVDVPQDLSEMQFAYSGDGTKGYTLNQFNSQVNDVVWRMQNQGHDTNFKQLPTFRRFNPTVDAVDKVQQNGSAGAWFTPAANDITFRGDINNQNIGLAMHEYGGHGLRYNLYPAYKYPGRQALNDLINGKIQEGKLTMNAKEVFNDTETKLVTDAYSDLVQDGPAQRLSDTGKLHEMAAINTQGRTNLSSRNNFVTKEKLNQVIDNTPNEEVIWEYLKQRYTEDGMAKLIAQETGMNVFDIIHSLTFQQLKEVVRNSKVLQNKAKLIKNAWKGVGISAGLASGIDFANKVQGNQNGGIIKRCKKLN